MKILITGAGGYVGSNLVKSLVKTNHSVYLVLRDSRLNNKTTNIGFPYHIYNGIENLICFFKEVEPELVIHAAGYIVNEYNSEELRILIESNIQFGSEILEAMRFSGCKNFINLGSIYQIKTPLNENFNLYAATKNAFEEIIVYYVKTYGFRVIKMRFSNIYGPYNNRSILNKIINHIGKPSKFVFYSYDKKINFIYIDQVVDSIISSINLFKNFKSIYLKPYIIKSNESIFLSELIELIEEVSHRNIKHNLKSKRNPKSKLRFNLLPRKYSTLKKNIIKIIEYNE